MSGPDGAADPELEAALKAVLKVVFRDHPLTANQLLSLAAELQKVGVHRLVEEHLERSRRTER
ncbi:MAG: hypothetical protein R3325_14980 [Thermoanaerobaculia bacterium]|nr:hypothetical protein [Thermoanaerobaculia bacterium]